jgi:DNA-binding transcriptional ArsR family regulator
MSASEDALGLDRLIHEPNRLAILTILSTTQDADFVFLLRALNLTNGNLSSHLTKLEDAGLVVIEKTFVGKKPRTSAALTSEGRTGIAAHWEQLERLRAIAVQPGSFG